MSGTKQDLDRLPRVHGLIAGGRLLERKLEVEDPARVDLPVPDQVDQLRHESAHRGGSSVQVHMREEHFLTGQLHAMGDADEPDVPTLPEWNGWPASSTPGCPRPRSPSVRPTRL